jgi:DNA invertase Pin-like site-specific DNA recombinase
MLAWTAVEYVDRGVSGAKDCRRALDRLLADARRRRFGRFDVLVCWRLDRLGRNLRHLITQLDDLQELGVAFVSLAEGIDATTPAGRLQMQILGAIAEFERGRIVERVRAGLARARAQEKRLGRPRHQLDPQQLRQLRGLSIREIGRRLGVSAATAHRCRPPLTMVRETTKLGSWMLRTARFRSTSSMAVVFFVLIASQRPADAACVVMPLDSLLARNEIVVIFGGTVQDLQTVPAGQIATFDTNWFWKGEPGGHVVIYNRQEAGVVEQLTLSKGVRYLVLAYRQSAVDREQFQLPPAGAERLATNFCSVRVFYSPYVQQQILKGAVGYPAR